MRRAFLPVALFVALASHTPGASADPPATADPASCARTFPRRLQDARRAIDEAEREADEYNAIVPWFEENCRFLSGGELLRYRRPPDSFVCETDVGRPRALTDTSGRRVRELMISVETPISAHQRLAAENLACDAHDRESRMSLVIPEDGEDEMTSAIVHVRCFEVRSEQCDLIRELEAEIERRREARARGEAP